MHFYSRYFYTTNSAYSQWMLWWCDDLGINFICFEQIFHSFLNCSCARKQISYVKKKQNLDLLKKKILIKMSCYSVINYYPLLNNLSVITLLSILCKIFKLQLRQTAVDLSNQSNLNFRTTEIMKIALDLIKIVWQNINALIPIKKGYSVSPQDSKKCQGHLF